MSPRTSTTFALPALAVRTAALWLLTGAFFKLFSASPKDLPPPILELFPAIDPLVKYQLAISIELAIGFFALLRPNPGWLPLAAIFAVFLAVLTDLMSRGAASCGCFGSKVSVPPWVMLLADGACLLAILATRPWKLAAGRLNPAIALPIVLGVAAPWFYLRAASSPAPGAGGVAQNDAAPANAQASSIVREMKQTKWLSPLKQKWVGKHIRDTELAQYLDVDLYPPDGWWILFRWTCEHCREHFLGIENRFAQNPQALVPIVLVNVPDENDEKGRVVEVLPPHVEPIAELSQAFEWAGQTPWTLELEGGIVKRAYLNDGAEEDSAKPK